MNQRQLKNTPGARKAKLPQFIPPQLATTTTLILAGFLCHEVTQFFSASLRKSRESAPTTLTDSRGLEAYIAGSTKKEVKPCRKFKRILSTVTFCSTGHNPKEGSNPRLLILPISLIQVVSFHQTALRRNHAN